MYMINIKQYGHYRTGTNLIRLLVSRYIDNICFYDSIPDHKHYLHDVSLWTTLDINDTKFIISIKNPFAWVVSFARWTENHLDKCADVAIKAWCLGYNSRYKDWLSINPNKTIVIRYEDLVVSQTDTLDFVKNKWNLKYKNKHIKDISATICAGGEIKKEWFDPSYYIKTRYWFELSNKHKEIIRENIDWNFFASFKYFP